MMAIVIVIILAVTLSSKKTTATATATEETDATDDTDGTDTTTTSPPLLPSVPPTSKVTISGKSFNFYNGMDATSVGAADEISKEPYVSLEAAATKLPTVTGAKAFVVYKGWTFYRPNIVSSPTQWTTTYNSTEGTYIPV